MTARLIVFFLIPVLTCQSSISQVLKADSVESRLKEFELINLCHCVEYLWDNHYKNYAWENQKTKDDYIRTHERFIYGQFASLNRSGNYYQKFYNNSLYLKNGISNHYVNRLNYNRLDSLYYKPILNQYLANNSAHPEPYLGLGDAFFFMDCFMKMKEIDLSSELEFFIKTNPPK